MDEPTGPISTFTDVGGLKPVPMPEKRPADLKRKWKIVGMNTTTKSIAAVTHHRR
ncbi:hypothetical protein ACIP9X_12190 [Arthrobacter sp. NPDC093125]|uniref:hypothetical protein n=1 Tax=Arthrobacter sp. NPDC093125 TaxID=3363944 RepID=UPI003827C156